MKLRELIRRPQRILKPTDVVGTAARALLWNDLRPLPVLDGSELVGVVRSRDLAWYTALIGSGADAQPVREMMRAAPRPASPDESINEAAARMATGHLDCLAVIESGAFLGLITTDDVLAAQVGDFRVSGPRPAVVKDIMTKHPATVHPGDRVLDAAARMHTRNVRHLPVINGEGQVVGMLSDRDLRSALGFVRQTGEQPSMELESLRVQQVMSHSVVAVDPEQTLVDVAVVLSGSSMSALPVVIGDDRLIGIISVVDVLRGLVSHERAVEASPGAQEAIM